MQKVTLYNAKQVTIPYTDKVTGDVWQSAGDFLKLAIQKDYQRALNKK